MSPNCFSCVEIATRILPHKTFNKFSLKTTCREKKTIVSWLNMIEKHKAKIREFMLYLISHKQIMASITTRLPGSKTSKTIQKMAANKDYA